MSALTDLTDDELSAEDDLAERYAKAVETEWRRRASVKRGWRPGTEHTVVIIAAGCETTRECYCDATYGYSHNEWDYPWITQSGARG